MLHLCNLMDKEGWLQDEDKSFPQNDSLWSIREHIISNSHTSLFFKYESVSVEPKPTTDAPTDWKKNL